MRLRVLLKARGLLAVGCGYSQVFGADIQLYSTSGPSGERIFLVPGSTVKGVLRSSACEVAPLVGASSCNETEPRRIAAKHREMGGECDVCTVFGRPGGYRGLLTVSHFKPNGKILVSTVARVGIDDPRGRAGEGRLYSTEHYEPGQEFEGSIILKSSSVLLTKLVLAALANLRFEPFGRGGWVDIKVVKHDISPEISEEPAVAELLSALSDWLGEMP